MATGWGSADLLRRFNQMAGRGANTADAITPDMKYQYLADAQDSVLTKIASIVPKVLYQPPAQLTSADGGLTWTYGTDGNGYELFPIGKAHIFSSLNAIPNYPWQPGVDYLDQGTSIRMPNNSPWTGQLWWYGIKPPGMLSANVAPILQPPSARILIVIEAARAFGERGAVNPALVDAMDKRWANEFGPTMTMIRTHVRGTPGQWGMVSVNSTLLARNY